SRGPCRRKEDEPQRHKGHKASQREDEMAIGFRPCFYLCGSFVLFVPLWLLFSAPGKADRPRSRALLENALRYADPKNHMTDPVSGYPSEGWNHDPRQGVFLRTFTQLTAIGLWMELLGNVAAGHVEAPFLPPDKAIADLTKLVKTLRQDQRDPRLSADGLL